ncbi:hypothetical protein CHGG_04951 [Chaetomium globosum CBS 148.51]|uniref:Uncharacterized protein n=1 Tax=Chaetomium globosum (strain ATCC 6205 / CBS 148.51 / DSM 1962 / NBRC 6347 / NRRL 1970) TaxID=306901 RepID=Q2GZU5_CHAGB|nr:uncharacterized protein CHGG_04951 [Chaetomium globosum CBS 148.51]EAQ88332.1 hypothetical protein CHGG_04951 [Chaetomium globosum CBS 148.51]
MEVSNTLSQADDGSGDISGVLVPPSEELVNLQGVSNGFDDPQLPWQENDPPTGDREVYAEVFHRERATGEFTEEPSTRTDFDRDSSIDPDDPDDNSDIEEQELGDVSIVPSPRTPTPASSSDGRRPKRRYALDSGAIAVARGIERLAESNTKVAGADDVSAAIQSFQSSSDSVITTSGKLKVIERLAMPMWAVVWNAMSTEMRSELAKKWAKLGWRSVQYIVCKLGCFLWAARMYCVRCPPRPPPDLQYMEGTKQRCRQMRTALRLTVRNHRDIQREGENSNIYSFILFPLRTPRGASYKVGRDH